MKADPPEVAAARAEADAARTQLMARAHELQDRLSPRTLTRDAWEGAKTKGADLVEDAVDAVRARPVAATGVVAAIALFLAREPLMELAGKLAGGVSGKAAARKSRTKKQGKTETKDDRREDERS